MAVERRVFFGLALAGCAGWGLNEWLMGAGDGARRLPERVPLAEFDSAGRLLGVAELGTIRKSDSEWKAQLALDQYMVTRRGDTEFAFTGEYWNFHGDGLYGCVCCGTALFDSVTKFNSGTGWPSFTEPVAKENVRESRDNGLFGFGRTEVSCSRCGGHLGHVFDDGPPPGGKRYCMNSVAMKFRSRA